MLAAYLSRAVKTICEMHNLIYCTTYAIMDVSIVLCESQYADKPVTMFCTNKYSSCWPEFDNAAGHSCLRIYPSTCCLLYLGNELINLIALIYMLEMVLTKEVLDTNWFYCCT